MSGTVLGALYPLSHLTSTRTYESHHYPCFIDEETEIQRGHSASESMLSLSGFSKILLLTTGPHYLFQVLSSRCGIC